MSTDSSSPLRIDGIDERRLRTVVKASLVAIGAIVVWAMVTSLPGLDELVPIRSVSLAALLGAVLTLAIVAALATVAFALETLLESVLSGPRKLVADAASMAKHGVLFVAAVVAYDGLAPALVPTLDAASLEWVYHLTFLAMALVPTVVVARRLSVNLDELTALLTARLLADDEDGEDVATRQ